jgi:hypothetical protein
MLKQQTILTMTNVWFSFAAAAKPERKRTVTNSREFHFLPVLNEFVASPA